MDLDYLKMATRGDHEGTEETVSLMDEALTLADYVGVLQRMYGAVRAWDDWAAQHVPEAFAALPGERRRSPLIAADLEDLGAEVPVNREGDGERWFSAYLKGNGAERAAAFLGAMYVMEGSTLGGQYIARQVERTLGLEPGYGDSYFRGYGDQTGSMWRDFKAVLAEVPDEHSEVVVRSAKRMFAFFAAQMTDTTVNTE